MEVVKRQKYSKRSEDCAQNHEKYGLLSEVRRRRQWVNLGQQVHKYENLLNRQFRAVRPNEKWVTDISYIHTKEGILYLSMIRDLYDNSIVAYKTASRQTVNLVLDTIRLAMKKEKVAAGCGSTATRLSIHIISILQANTILRHNAVHVKERKSL